MSNSIKRPQSIRTALWLMIISVVVGFVVGFAAMFITKRSPKNNGFSDPLMLLIIALMLFYIVAIIQMFRRKKWARIVFTVTVAISIVNELEALISGKYDISNSELQTLINIVIVFLLFRKDSNDWYNYKPVMEA